MSRPPPTSTGRHEFAESTYDEDNIFEATNRRPPTLSRFITRASAARRMASRRGGLLASRHTALMPDMPIRRAISRYTELFQDATAIESLTASSDYVSLMLGRCRLAGARRRGRRDFGSRLTRCRVTRGAPIAAITPGRGDLGFQGGHAMYHAQRMPTEEEVGI